MPVDHLAAMLARLIEQFKGLPNLGAFFKAYGNQLNDIEEFFGQLMTDVILQNAVGVQLDKLGAALGQGRNSLSDSDYRTLLEARVVEYQSNGTVEDILQLMLVLTGATQVQLVENGDADFTVTAVNPNPPVSAADVIAAVLLTKVSGVGAKINSSITLPVFQLDRPATSQNAGLDVGHFSGPYS